MRQYALPILEDYGVDLVLCGHSHSYERSYLLDSHYGLSETFSSANQVDSGDGDPDGDGAYRKYELGATPHSGAVYVVNGSGSEVREATLNHPAMLVGLLQTGSVVLDIDGDVLTARFLSGAAEIRDTFRIVKESACGAAPAAGCGMASQGKILIKGGADTAKHQWSWKWKGGTVDAEEFGDPAAQTDLAVCVYDANGVLLGGALPHGAAAWKINASGAGYTDKTLSRHGIQKIKLKFGDGSIQIKAKGAGTAIPPLPVVFPVTAQLVNLDSGACWESVFATEGKNDSTQVSAKLP
jgi:hypothetical protein